MVGRRPAHGLVGQVERIRVPVAGEPAPPGLPFIGLHPDHSVAWARQLYVLYVIAADHGTGAGPALLSAVVNSEESVALWVADPNPRAQAFYRKHGFVADGSTQIAGLGVREIRMVRGTYQDPDGCGSPASLAQCGC